MYKFSIVDQCYWDWFWSCVDLPVPSLAAVIETDPIYTAGHLGLLRSAGLSVDDRTIRSEISPIHIRIDCNKIRYWDNPIRRMYGRNQISPHSALYDIVYVKGRSWMIPYIEMTYLLILMIGVWYSNVYDRLAFHFISKWVQFSPIYKSWHLQIMIRCFADTLDAI